MEGPMMTGSTRHCVLVMLAMTLAGVPVVADPVDADAFSHEQDVLVPAGDHEYYSVELSGLHYRIARPDLDDLRVRDSRGVYCPYILNSSRTEETSEQVSYETTAIGVIEETLDDVPVIHHDFQVVEFPREGEVNAIVLETDAADFSCQVRVFARTAKSGWYQIATDTLYRLDDVVKLSVEMDEVVLYQFWRITVDAPSPLTACTATPRLDRKRSESQGFLKEMPLDFEISETNRDGRTILDVINPDRLRLVSLTLDTDALFKRTVRIQSGSRHIASEQLYRIPSGDTLAVDTTIQLPGSGIRDELFELIIENRDDEPLRVGRIDAQYRMDYLVFKPSGYPPYVLVFGNTMLEKPVYDLSAYRDEVLAGSIAPASLGNPVQHAVPEAVAASGKTLFTVIVLVSAVVLFALSLMIFIKRPGSQQ